MDPSSVYSFVSPRYQYVFVNDTNPINVFIGVTGDQGYTPASSDLLKLYANGVLLAGLTGGTGTTGSTPSYMYDDLQTLVGGVTYTAFFQTGTTGITLGQPIFVNVLAFGVSLAASTISPGVTNSYSNNVSDGVTYTVVLRDLAGNLYNSGSSYYSSDFTVGLRNGGIPSNTSLFPPGTTGGSTYSIFLSTYSPTITTANYTTVEYVVSRPNIDYSKPGTSSSLLQIGARNVLSPVESSITLDPISGTNRTQVNATVRINDVMGKRISGSSNINLFATVSNNNLNPSGLSFSQGNTSSVLTKSQDSGVTGQFTVPFAVSDSVTSNLYLSASYNGVTLSLGDIASFTYYQNDPSLVPCFFGDAPVLTDKGYRRIDKIRVGDILVTPDDRHIAVKRLVSTKVAAGRETNPYIIPKGKFGALEKLLISPNHKVNVKGTMIEAKNLGLTQEYKSGILSYYNIELEKSGNMLVAGVDVETLIVAKEVLVTPEQFMASLKKRYGNVSQEMYDEMLSKFKIMPDGRIRCFTRTN